MGRHPDTAWAIARDKQSDRTPSVVLGPHCPVFPSWLRVNVCLRLRTALVSAGRPCIAALLPLSGDGPNARNKALRARPSPRSPCLRPRRLALNSAPGPGSGVAAPQRPLSFLQALRSSAGRAASSQPVVPSVLLAASAFVWTPHTRVPSQGVTTGNVAGEQGGRPLRVSSPAWARRSEAPNV